MVGGKDSVMETVLVWKRDKGEVIFQQGTSSKFLGSIPAFAEFLQYFKMSAKSLMLDYGLPGLVAFGTGVLIFMLTGGPDQKNPVLLKTVPTMMKMQMKAKTWS
jgi:hypothetical protein